MSSGFKLLAQIMLNDEAKILINSFRAANHMLCDYTCFACVGFCLMFMWGILTQEDKVNGIIYVILFIYF